MHIQLFTPISLFAHGKVIAGESQSALTVQGMNSPTLLVSNSVNQSVPPGPAVMPIG